MIYFGIFSSQLVYASQIWAQTQNRHVNQIEKLQNNALRVINFAHFRDSSNALCYKTKVLKLNDCVKIQNFVYVLESIKGNLPTALNNSFELTKNIYEYNTRGSLQYNVSVPKAHTQMYGIKSIKYQSVQFWNHIMKTFPDKQLQAHSKTVCKNTSPLTYLNYIKVECLKQKTHFSCFTKLIKHFCTILTNTSTSTYAVL